MVGFRETPSFYDSNEKFIKYLGQTSYYRMLQHCVGKVVGHAKPNSLLELGFGTGATSIILAADNQRCKVTAVDIRAEMKELARQNASSMGFVNIDFVTDDMISYIQTAEFLPEFVLLLYSFHHIEDPLTKKVDFLKSCFAKMAVGSRLCIAETFLPEALPVESQNEETQKLWDIRKFEAYTSTFWSSLAGLTTGEIESSKDIAKYSLENEARAGELVCRRDKEYLVTMKWLADSAREIGFTVELQQYCNTVGDGIVLLRKIETASLN